MHNAKVKEASVTPWLTLGLRSDEKACAWSSVQLERKFNIS